MTAEQLEEILAAWDAGSECEGLQNLAPSLARRVIAAEKMAKLLEEGECPWIEDTNNYREWWKERASALAAYREASK